MTQFIAFALYLCVSCTLLIAVPVLMHPTLRPRYKLLICTTSFFVLVPIALAIYAYIGAPNMAVSG